MLVPVVLDRFVAPRGSEGPEVSPCCAASVAITRMSHRQTGSLVVEVSSFAPDKIGTYTLALNCQSVAEINVLTNAYPTITSNSAPLPNAGFVDFDRKADFVEMQMVLNDQRTQANKLPDELEFYKRWRATEGDGLMN